MDGTWMQPFTDRFAKYPSVGSGIVAHALLIAHNNRYAAAMQRAHNGPTDFLYFLKMGGDSTTPDYANRVMTIIRLYSLEQYDHVVAMVLTA